MDVLSEIIARKRQRIATDKEGGLPLKDLRVVAQESRASAQPHAFAAALSSNRHINLIAEFKRRSPSKGPINVYANPAAMAEIYETAGAAAISVLTEEDYFGGSIVDLHSVRGACQLPVLRKDFIVDERQVIESAVVGADALLLIASALDDQTLMRLRTITEDEFGMDALVEVHSEQELDRAIRCDAKIIGVNNRDLRTFEVSVETSHRLARLAPEDVILVSESGLTPYEVRKLRDVGYRGFLVGEALMRAPDPAHAIRRFVGRRQSRSSWPPLVKICGITNIEDARASIAAGADMLGFNFYQRSPRFVETDTARQIIASVRSEAGSWNSPVTMVGVFVDEPAADVLRIAREVGLDGIQLHGDEEVDYCSFFDQGVWPLFLIKVVRPNGLPDFAALSRYSVDAFMLDAYDPKLHGGTGRRADWTVASDATEQLPRLFLAGGLSPENVAEAINTVEPYAVDACSALEVSPGRKDHARVREFVAVVRASKLPSEASVP